MLSSRTTTRALFAAASMILAACGSDLGAPRDDGTTRTPPRRSTTSGTDVGANPGEAPAAPSPGSLPLGPPLPATPPDQWTWLGAEHFGGAVRCMDGSTTGLAVNRHPGSRKVLIYMQGGAACFDGQTCTLTEQLLGADHANQEDYDAWVERQGDANVFNRARPENPFRDYDFVMLPYCSGDVFTGDIEAGYQGRPQHGYRNVSEYLRRLVPTFRDATGVVLTGMSAGGYGAAYNFVQVQQGFDWVPVTMIDDSAPIFDRAYTPPCLQQKWKTSWGMEKTLPIAGPFVLGYDEKSGVAGNGLAELWRAILTRYPKNKFALVTSEHDLAMRYFHGIGHSESCASPRIMSETLFEAALRDVRAIPNPNFWTFYGPGAGHPYFLKDEPMYETRVDDVSIAEWLGRIVEGGAAPRQVPGAF